MNVYEKIGRLVIAAFEIGGIALLGGLAIDAECKRHKAECKRIDAELLLRLEKLYGVLKDAEIRRLRKELEKNQKGGLV